MAHGASIAMDSTAGLSALGWIGSRDVSAHPDTKHAIDIKNQIPPLKVGHAGEGSRSRLKSLQRIDLQHKWFRLVRRSVVDANT